MFTKEHFDKIASVLNAARNSYDAPAIAAAHGNETESIVHAELGKLIDNISGKFADMFAEFDCTACGRNELTCSQDPCADVQQDRLS